MDGCPFAGQFPILRRQFDRSTMGDDRWSLLVSQSPKSLYLTNMLYLSSEDGESPSSYTVRLGAHDDQAKEPTQVDAKIEKYFVNPQFDPTAISHDITLLKV